MEHLFWFFPTVKTFWLQILDAINASEEIRSNLNDINVILGGVEGHNKDSLNYLFTIVNTYVYNTKCKHF